MAKTKLTLTVERNVVERARRYSRKNNTSISALVSRFLDSLDRRDEVREYPPIVSSLLGIAEGAGDEEEYRRHLERKYLKS